MPNMSELEIGRCDPLGQTVSHIYYRKTPIYCVYATDGRVMIGYADDAQRGLADRQRKRMSELAPVRGQIDALVDGWREGTDRAMWGARHSPAVQAKAKGYNRRVADALAVALEGDTPCALMILATIKQEILDERVARARFEYLIAAILAALGLMFMSWLVTATYRLNADRDWLERVSAVGLVTLLTGILAAGMMFCARWRGLAQEQAPPGQPKAAGDHDGNGPARFDWSRLFTALWPCLFLLGGILILVKAAFWRATFVAALPGSYDPAYREAVGLWRAAAAGSIGAFFSIAISIRKRTILPDLLRTSNEMDAALRVSIGFIGAAVLVALLKLGLVKLTLGGYDFADPRPGDTELLAILAAGFIAGFSERLVPDLLERANAVPGGTPPIRMPPTVQDNGSGAAQIASRAEGDAEDAGADGRQGQAQTGQSAGAKEIGAAE